MNFTIYPAIDLRNGSVVRLEHGDPDRQTIFGADPAEVAENWVESGATWLHVVNLDGAFDQTSSVNTRLLSDIASMGAKVQFGGGLRTLKDVAQALSRGASRVVLGTAAVEDPDLLETLVRRFGADQVAVGIDALHGRVRTHGWTAEASLAPEVLGLQMRALGITRIIYTDINRDGVLSGVNSQAASRLAQATSMRVIASGGVATLDDVRSAVSQAPRGVDGLIIGRALYDGRVSLGDALEVAEQVQG